VYHSTLGSRVIKERKRKKKRRMLLRRAKKPRTTDRMSGASWGETELYENFGVG
jgi:hypothetical protein